MEQVAWAHKLGADKYGPWNWRETGVCASTYVNAIMRHLNAWRDGEDLDPESGFSHLAHIACSCNILMDAAAVGKLQDDRNKLPTNGEAEEDSTIEGILQEWLESAREDMEDFGFELAEDTVPEYHVLLREGDKLQDGDEVYIGEDHWLPVYVADWITPAVVRNGTYRRKITKCDLKEKVADCDLKEEPEDLGECTCGRRYIYHWLYGWICEDCEIKYNEPY
jgi:hypothetical protein